MGSYEDRLGRLEAAVRLEPVDKIPLVSGSAAFAAVACGEKLSDFIEDPVLNCDCNIKVTQLMGEVDGVQTALSTPDQLPALWFSQVKSPGRELPENELWQIIEQELIPQSAYDEIIEGGYDSWAQKFIAEKLTNPKSKMPQFLEYMPTAIQRFAEAGYPIINGGASYSPLEMLCGGRSLMGMLMDDLIEIPDKVDAVFKLAHESNMRGWEAYFQSPAKPWGMWVGGWRGMIGLLTPEMFERFSWPYMMDCINLCLDNGVVPILHLDADWSQCTDYFVRDLPSKKIIMALDSKTDMRKMKDAIGDKVCLMGDVPPEILTFGKPRETYDYVTALAKDIGPTGYICCSGCDIPYNAKLENVQEMSEALLDLAK